MLRLANASRRGRLAGYHAHERPSEFHIRIFGEPFDRRLVGEVRPDASGSRVAFHLVTLRTLPIVFIVFAIFTVWPGVWLTDSMLETYYPPSKDWWWIGWWYIPLTALPLPWAARKMWRKSQATAHSETAQAIERVEAALATEIKTAGAARPGADADLAPQRPAPTPG